jgi:protein-arginine kinase activator protein McsA
MENTFFDEDFIKNIRLVLCPSCKTEFKVSLEQTEIFCYECGESFYAEPAMNFPEDFVWHPSEKY